MSRRKPTSQGARATIAVVALYAFVLQAFFTGLLPVAGAKAHGFAELCSPVSGDGEAPGRHDAKGCCTAACAPLAVPLPQADAASVPWSRRATSRVVSAQTAPPQARAPPVHDHSPRGPPAA